MLMIKDDLKKILISEEQIRQRCFELGRQLDHDYADNQNGLLFVGILKGSVPFMAELIKRVTLDIEIDFMAVSSYQGTESLGDIKIIKDLDHSIVDRDLVLVEDIVDTGISQVNTTQQNGGKAFNLAGQQVKQGYKGIVIKDGKKFVIK